MAKKDSYAFYEDASPEKMAAQPVAAPTKKPSAPKVRDISEKDWAVLRSHLESRLSSLRTWRDTWWIQNYSDLARFILPRRSIWLTQSAGGMPSPNTMTRGLEINDNILDPTATFAARVTAGGLASGLASPSRPWFKMMTAQRSVQIDDEGRQWLDTVEDILYTVMARSNFYNAFAQECEDIVIYGTAVNIMYEDKKDLIRCYTPCVGEYYLASGATMRVDCLNRAFVMTISQIVDFFGVENCSPEIQKMWNEKGGALATERLIAHSIEPNFAVGNGVGKIKGDFAWREVYWVFGAGAPYPLVMRGFVDCPFSAARWATQSNDAYGRSPGMDVLPDVIQLQVETGRKGEGIEKGLRPPLLAHSELKNYPSSQLPGQITYLSDVGPGKGMRSIYDQQFELQYVTQDILAIQARIKTGLFVDLFMLVSETAQDRESTVLTNAKIVEKMQILGPVIENMLSEGLQPKLRRLFGILRRQGMIPPPPDSMKGVALDIQFVSVLALAQKSANLGGAEALVKMAGELAQIKPEVLDNLDADVLIQQYSNLLGNSQKVLHSAKTVQMIRDARIQQQQKQQQMAAATQTADTVQKAAGAANTLSQTDVGSGQSALSQILGTGGNSPRL